MKTYFVGYIAALVALAILDGLWLGLLSREFYKARLGQLLLEQLNWYAAILFYLIHALGIVVFAVPLAGSWAAAVFYGGLFGWTFGEPSMPARYSMIENDKGGLWDTSAMGGTSWAIFYVQVDNVQAALDRAQELGATVAVPLVDNGQIVIGKVMKVNATFDHRFIDGLHAAIMSKVLREHMDRPYEFFDKI